MKKRTPREKKTGKLELKTLRKYKIFNEEIMELISEF